MSTRRSKLSISKQDASTPQTVNDFIAALNHPLKPEVIALRQIILGADSRISQGIKWNVPSFRTTEYFATFYLRAKESIQIILHFGAKPRALPVGDIAIADPEALLTWLAKDRASVTFRNLAEINAHRPAFEAIIRAWIAHI